MTVSNCSQILQILKNLQRLQRLGRISANLRRSANCGNCQTFIYYGVQDLIVATATASAKLKGRKPRSEAELSKGDLKMMQEIYRDFAGNGGYIWSIYLTEERNNGILKIHSQSMGETFEIRGVWDSDALKLVRYLNSVRYSHIPLEKLVQKVNRICRHLELFYLPNEFGGFGELRGFGDFGGK